MFERVFGNAMDEMPVDLDVVGPDFGPHAQIGETFAEVVDGDPVAEAAVMRQRLLHVRIVVDALILGEFDHHTARADADLV